jgi:ribosomal protein L11 methyltransferase
MNKPKTWIELTVPVEASAAEAVENFLFEQGCLGIEELAGTIKGYFHEAQIPYRLKRSLLLFIQNLQDLGFTAGVPDFRKIEAQDWSSQWQKWFKPIRISRSIIVKPPWENWPYRSGETVVTIMPRMAFGTGTHETTQLCLSLLEAVLQPHQCVLDVGTGSGILAIAAALMGASRVLAVDTDIDAISNAEENSVTNHVNHRLEIRLGSLEAVDRESFDLILANINRMVLLNLLLRMRHLLNPEGGIILSGILETERPVLEKAIEDSGYSILRFQQIGEWIGFFITCSR